MMVIHLVGQCVLRGIGLGHGPGSAAQELAAELDPARLDRRWFHVRGNHHSLEDQWITRLVQSSWTLTWWFRTH